MASAARGRQDINGSKSQPGRRSRQRIRAMCMACGCAGVDTDLTALAGREGPLVAGGRRVLCRQGPPRREDAHLLRNIFQRTRSQNRKSQSVQNSGPDNYVPVRRWYKHDEASEQVARNGSKHAGRGEVAGRQRRLGLVCSSSGGGGGGGVAISPLVGTIGHARWMPAKHSSVAMVVLMAPGLTIILIAAARCATYSRPAAARR
jgi:hypothetical protein